MNKHGKNSLATATGASDSNNSSWPYTPWGTPLDVSKDVDWEEINRFMTSIPEFHKMIALEASYKTGANTSTGQDWRINQLGEVNEIVKQCILEGADKFSVVFAVPRVKHGYSSVTGLTGANCGDPTFVFSNYEGTCSYPAYLFERSISVKDRRLINLLQTFGDDDNSIESHIFYQCRAALPGIRGWTFDSKRKDRPIYDFANLELATYRNTIRELELRLMDDGEDEDDTVVENEVDIPAA